MLCSVYTSTEASAPAVLSFGIFVVKAHPRMNTAKMWVHYLYQEAAVFSWWRWLSFEYVKATVDKMRLEPLPYLANSPSLETVSGLILHEAKNQARSSLQKKFGEIQLVTDLNKLRSSGSNLILFTATVSYSRLSCRHQLNNVATFEAKPPPMHRLNIIFTTKLQVCVNGQLSPLQTTCEGVTISEVSGRDLCLRWSQATDLDWVFEISTAVRAWEILALIPGRSVSN